LTELRIAPYNPGETLGWVQGLQAVT
jgi:hypothetical protein